MKLKYKILISLISVFFVIFLNLNSAFAVPGSYITGENNSSNNSIPYAPGQQAIKDEAEKILNKLKKNRNNRGYYKDYQMIVERNKIYNNEYSQYIKYDEEDIHTDGLTSEQILDIKKQDKIASAIIESKLGTGLDYSALYNPAVESGLKNDLKKAGVDVDKNESNAKTAYENFLAKQNTQNKTEGGQETEKEKQYRECSRSAFIFGWLICPALLDMSESFLGKLYEWIYLRFAKVESGLFRSYQDNPVFKAWEVVKDFSNVVFIIMFMLVIISQISGFGISNYGIKKSLPKIIAAAILINMSFFISQLFVDTSNIIGSSIVNFMNNLGGEVSGKVSINAGATTALSTVLIGVIGFAVLNPASLITLALMLIPVATALLLAFALLMIRQVAVVMLVIMSPLIVALYILPNTRSVVEKYKRLAFSMWLFYPATAFIIGASGLTARIFVLISNADGTDNQFVYTVIALAVLVMPFFMIPKLLTKTMDGIGGIGAKLSGARLKASRGAVTKLNNTRAMKRARNAMNSWGGDSRFGRMRNFLTGGAVAKAISDQEKLRKEANMEKVTMDSGARRERAMMDKIQFDEAMNKDLREERIINADLKHLQNIDKDAIKDRTEQSIMGHKVSMAEIAARNNYTDYYDNMTASKVNSAQSKIKQQMVETTIEAINAGNHTVSGGSYIDAGGNKISGDVKISNPRDVGQLTNALQSAVSSRNSISVQAISSYMAKNGMEKDLISTYESLSSGGGMGLEIQDSSITDMVSMRESMMQGMAAGGISDPILKKLSKQHNSGQNEVSIQTASISAAADLTAEKLSAMDVESIQAIEKSLMEATKNLAVDPATGIYNTSSLDSKTREAIKTMGNISSQFNPANPNSSHLRGKTKQENMDAIEKMFNTHSKLADIYSSL